MRDVRIGRAERTEVLSLLNGAYDAGLLAVEALDERVAAVGTATYASELRAQVADLPPAYAWGPAVAAPPAAGRSAPPAAGPPAAGPYASPPAASPSPPAATNPAAARPAAVGPPAAAGPPVAAGPPAAAGPPVATPPAAAGPPAATPPPAAAGRIALILGIASVPFSFCLIGGILGLLAVIASRRGGPVPGGPRVTPALIGRIFGILGMVLSLGAAFALVHARNNPIGP